MRAVQGANPIEVRQKWDSLLSVINSPAATGLPPPKPAAVDGEEGQAQLAVANPSTSGVQLPRVNSEARQLLAPSGQMMPQRRGKPQWDDRHHLLYSVINARMQRNLRSYFDRPREPDADGLRLNPILRTTWQLETAEDPEDEEWKRLVKESRGTLPGSRSVTKSNSTPELSKGQKWDARHHVLFNKDNHYYHPNYREYFETPKDLLY
mmetsp:Transcript_42612/g.91427  ORF Transcript_42612/g.91427 Transcript_42612/m.91427 type:complete len:208 (+) Transcript_42612:52-675(+)